MAWKSLQAFQDWTILLFRKWRSNTCKHSAWWTQFEKRGHRGVLLKSHSFDGSRLLFISILIHETHKLLHCSSYPNKHIFRGILFLPISFICLRTPSCYWAQPDREADGVHLPFPESVLVLTDFTLLAQTVGQRTSAIARLLHSRYWVTLCSAWVISYPN